MSKYISLLGVPYLEMDCWAVVREFYKLEFGVSLQMYYEGIPETRDMAKDLIYSSMKDFDKVEGPRKYGDILLIKLFGVESHIAVYIGEGKILHTSNHSGCIVERVARWEKLVVGTYRVRDINNEQLNT